MIPSLARQPSIDEAIAMALDIFIDRLASGADVHEAFNGVASNAILRGGGIPVDHLTATTAMLDDGTTLLFDPDESQIPWTTRTRAMLGCKVLLTDLPSAASSDTTPAVRTAADARMWAGPGRNGRAVLRHFNDGDPVLTGEGVRLWAPDDAMVSEDGLLLETPTVRIYLTEDGTVDIHDADGTENAAAAPVEAA